jgi:flagellar L-ring protein precursor FlgH
MKIQYLSLLILAACGAAHISPYVQKHRDYPTPAPAADDVEKPTIGSLWQPGKPASMLFTDSRALRQNDLVVIKVEEVANAQRTANTDLTHNSTFSAAITALYQALGAQNQQNPFTMNLAATLANQFNGDGSTGRTDQLTATVPATVRKVMPNGDLFIEGHRVILVNAEEHHFYISGIIRPIDIDQQNTVKSSMIADAEIEFTGQGVLTDNARPGFLTRLLGWIWPF